MENQKTTITTMTSHSDPPMLTCGHAANAKRVVGQDREEWIPCCAICDCIEQAPTPPDLTGRMARCCGPKSEKISSPNLAFFEYLGPGSRRAMEICACGFTQDCHNYDWPNGNRVSKTPPRSMCDSFTPRGPREFDSYYCGCRGWD